MNEEKSVFMGVPEYRFPERPEDRDYKVFPDDLEEDPNVFFHGTSASQLSYIKAEGFKIPAPPKAQSVSFAITSALSLRYASEARDYSSPDGAIIAVRYTDLACCWLRNEGTILHDYKLSPPPLIIGYCIVPSHYKFR